MRKQLLLFTFLLVISLLQATAQKGTVRGFVYDKENGEPILFTNVYLKGTTYGAATDVNGYYSITNVPVGKYILFTTSIGYDSMLVNIEVKTNEIVTKQLTIKRSAINLKDVEISAEKEVQRTEVRTSVTKVTPREIKMLPSVGGEPDLAQYMQVLPGVVFSGDQGGQLYIRGGTPVMNKVLLDGMVIYNPFHSIGLFSVFDSDIIRNADVYTGGFSAEYGGRISSVMDITTRDGNKKRIAGKVSSNPFTSKLLVEGPLQKQKTEGGGGSSFIFTAKNSYLDQTSPKLYSYIDDKGLPYSFLDIYGKISMYGESGSKLSVFGFQFKDDANYRFLTDNSWKSAGGGFNFVLVPGGSSNLIDGNFAYSKYNISQSEAEQEPRTSSVDGFNLDMNFTNFMGKNELKYGFQVLGFKTSFATS
ncbi:MAG: TonB-dependent receptor, partial [Bacteroidota bacterium]